MKPYVFEPDLSRAATLPADWYSDPAVLGLEQRRVFAGSWQLVGHTGQVGRRGQYFPVRVGGEPVLVVRGEDDVVRALSNVCRHRAGPVATGIGQRKVLTCGY